MSSRGPAGEEGSISWAYERLAALLIQDAPPDEPIKAGRGGGEEREYRRLLQLFFLFFGIILYSLNLDSYCDCIPMNQKLICK